MSNIIIRDLKLSEETRQLIDDAVDSGMVTKIQPAAAASNEMSSGTRELIARQRRAFRKAERLANQ